MYVHWYFEEYLLGLYRIRLSHIFETSSISNEKPSISREMPSISTKNLVFQKRCEIAGFKWVLCMSSSIGFRNTRIRRLLS